MRRSIGVIKVRLAINPRKVCGVTGVLYHCTVATPRPAGTAEIAGVGRRKKRKGTEIAERKVVRVTVAEKAVG